MIPILVTWSVPAQFEYGLNTLYPREQYYVDGVALVTRFVSAQNWVGFSGVTTSWTLVSAPVVTSWTDVYTQPTTLWTLVPRTGI